MLKKIILSLLAALMLCTTLCGCAPEDVDRVDSGSGLIIKDHPEDDDLDWGPLMEVN